jgi:hypothetical protein
MTLATRAVGLALVLSSVVACAGPTLDDEDMRSQASRSAGSAVSALQTMKLAVQSQLDGKAWWRFTDVTVTDVETTLSTIESTLSSRQPPSADSARATRTVVDVLGNASDLAREIRIATRDHDDVRLRRLVREVQPISRHLSQLEESTL